MLLSKRGGILIFFFYGFNALYSVPNFQAILKFKSWATCANVNKFPLPTKIENLMLAIFRENLKIQTFLKFNLIEKKNPNKDVINSFTCK